MDGIGHKRWVIPEGWIPAWSHGPAPLLTSHEAACILNVNDADAHVSIRVYFEDREPAGPFELVVPARRTRHVRFNDLGSDDPIPRATAYSSVIDSDETIVVQHTRLDSRSRRLGVLSTLAFPA